MNVSNLTATPGLAPARVVALLEDDTVAVLLDATGERVLCDLLHTGPQPLALAADDQVLIWRASGSDRGVLVGRVGPTSRAAEQDIPDELTLEAKANLTLKCGDGSITIRSDGKIMIKGKNLVSLALETNRIKGASVSIN